MKTSDLYTDDARRINEQLEQDYDIQNKKDYVEALEKFLGKKPTQKQVKLFFEKGDGEGLIKRKKLFSEAGGLDIKKDRKKTHRIVLSDPKTYTKKGARRSDLIGLDTARKFAYLKNRRRMIDTTRTKIVSLKPTFERKYKTGKTITVKRKVLQEIRVYDKTGRRLSLKRKKKL